jgi:hypothetical protein
MKITRIELHLIRVPFDMGAAPTAFAGMNLTSVDSLFVRVCTDADVDGWGEGWGHVACPTTSAALPTLVGPAFIGSDISDRSRLMTEMFRRFHIHGRTGPVVYALGLSGVASPRGGLRAGGRLRALLRRPASQPVSRRRARSPGPTVSAARAGPGTRPGHGGT